MSSLIPRTPAPFGHVRWALTALFAVVLSASAVGAQEPALPPRPDAPDVCLGFAFGRWVPALDWKTAGHARVDSSLLQRAPTGRDWATQGASSDTAMLLFPAWWPAGVWVALPTGSPAEGDTLVGRATALVADGRRTAPEAAVRAWRVACGGRR